MAVAEVSFADAPDLIDSDNIRCRWQNHVDTGTCRFDCFDPVIDLSPSIEKLARDSRIVGAVSSLYGERSAVVFSGHHKLACLPPKDGMCDELTTREVDLSKAVLSYNAHGDGGDQREKHYAEFKAWLMERYAGYGKTNIFL